MTDEITRRRFTSGLGLALAGTQLMHSSVLMADGSQDARIAPFRTPYKYGQLVLGPSRVAGSFDEKSVDDPFVFFHDGKFQMLYIAFDGIGYQTGLARSNDLIHWERVACVARRDPNSRYTKYNVALACLLRDDTVEIVSVVDDDGYWDLLGNDPTN